MGTVTAQNIRITDAESIGNWVGIGGGAGMALETDFSYQGSQCVARKGSTSERGFGYNWPASQNIAGGVFKTAMLKLICTTPGLLDTKASQAFSARIGSSASAYYQYDLEGSDTYPLTKSWLIVAIDPNVPVHRSSSSGSPNLSSMSYTGLVYDQSGTSKSPNQGVDAIDIGSGLTVVGVSSAWQDFIDFDENTLSNRFGYISTIEGVIFALGQMVIGSATPTTFIDSGRTVVFPDGLFAAGFSGITVNLQGASVVELSDHTLIGRGDASGEDTRPVLSVTGLVGTFLMLSGKIEAFASIDLTAGCNLQSTAISNSGQISANSAQMVNCTIAGSTASSAIVVNSPAELALLVGLSFISNAGHSIEITQAGTYDLTGFSFSGGGADETTTADVYNNSGGHIDISGNAPTVRNGAGGTSAIVSQPTTLTLNDIVVGSRVSIIRASDRAILSETLNSGSAFEYAYQYTVDIDVWIRIITLGSPWFEIDYTLGATDAAIPINQSNDRVFRNP